MQKLFFLEEILKASPKTEDVYLRVKDKVLHL